MPEQNAAREQQHRPRVQQVNPARWLLHHEYEGDPREEQHDRAQEGEIHVRFDPSVIRVTLGCRVEIFGATSLDEPERNSIVGPGAGSPIIEPTGSIVDPDTATDVMPPRGGRQKPW